MDNHAIVVCGQKFDIGVRVVLWDEPNGLSLYKSKYGKRDLGIEELRKQVNSFVLHHSVTYRAKDTHNGLIGRGLSVNFMIDDDNVDGLATIYQCLDVKDAGYSHAPMNFAAPGVEICYYPNAWEKPNLYSIENQKKFKVSPHATVEDKIHGQKLKCFAPTQAQVKSCVALAYGLGLAFPEINMRFPRENGQIVKKMISNPKGLLNHYMITNQKIDAAGFPSEFMEEQLKIWERLGL